MAAARRLALGRRGAGVGRQPLERRHRAERVQRRRAWWPPADADGGVAVGQADQRQRLGQRVAHPRILLWRAPPRPSAPRRPSAWLPSLMAAPRRTSGSGLANWHARLVGIEERLDGDAQPPVGRDLDQVGHRHRAQRAAVVGASRSRSRPCRPCVDLPPPTTTSSCPPFLRAYTLPSRSAARNASHFGSRVSPITATAASRRSASAPARSASARSTSAAGRAAWPTAGAGEPRHDQQREGEPSHHAFFWYVPWCLTQSQPLSGLVYVDSTAPAPRAPWCARRS